YGSPRFPRRYQRSNSGEKPMRVSEATARQRRLVATMMRDCGWTRAQVKGAPFKHLSRLASNYQHLTRQQRERILELAVKRTPFREYEAALISARDGVKSERRIDKMITGSESSIAAINKYCQAARERGDTRFEGDIIAEALSS